MSGDTTKLHVYDMLARCFSNEGVDVCFGLMGDANMNWAARLSEAGCRFVYVRHEHCAVAAAMAYSRKSGEVGVATVTCGPGLTQTMTALAAAVIANVPLVIFAGEPPVGTGWYNQAIDQAPFVKAAGASYHSLHSVKRMATAVRDAFIEAQEERRPVVLGVPMDLQEMPWDGTGGMPTPARSLLRQLPPIPPHADDVAAVAAMVSQAKRIVVLAGLGAGAADAAEACLTLAEHCDGIVATTLPARGLFHEEQFSAGIAGGLATPAAAEVFAEADLVLAFGASLAHHTSLGGDLWPGAKVVQINQNPHVISQGRVCSDYLMRADATLAAEALRKAVAPRSPVWRSAALAEKLATPAFAGQALSQPDDGSHDPRRAVDAIQAAIPRDWQIVNTSGHVSYFTAQMPGRPQDAYFVVREFGAIGNGTSFAMGVAAARPDTPVVLIEGDGSFMMHIQELETMRRSGMKILVLVLNDGAYGSEIHKLRAHGLSDEGAVFGRPDFAAVAKGFGLAGHRLEALGDLTAIIDRFAVGDHVTVVDIPISDQVRSPNMKRRIAKP